MDETEPPGDDYQDLVEWLADDTANYVGAGSIDNSEPAQPSLASPPNLASAPSLASTPNLASRPSLARPSLARPTTAPYVSPYSFHLAHSDTSAPQLTAESSPQTSQPDTTQDRSRDLGRRDLRSHHVRPTSFLPFSRNPAPRAASATTSYRSILSQEAQNTAQPVSSVEMPPPPLPRGVRRGASQVEHSLDLPQPGITPHGGVPGVAGHYARAAPHSSFTYTGTAAQPSTTPPGASNASQYATHGLPNFTVDTTGMQDWTDVSQARARTGDMPPPLLPASLMRANQAAEALLSLHQSGQHSTGSRRPSTNAQIQRSYPPMRSANDSQGRNAGYTSQSSGTINPYEAADPTSSPTNSPHLAGISLSESNRYPDVSLPNTRAGGAFVRPSRKRLSRLAATKTPAPFIPGRPHAYSTPREPPSVNPYTYFDNQELARRSLSGPIIRDPPFQSYEELVDPGPASQGQPSGDVQQRVEPVSPAPGPEQRIVTDFMEYQAPVTLYEIVPETTGCRHAYVSLSTSSSTASQLTDIPLHRQAWLLNVTSDPRPSPTLIPADVPQPQITTRFFHSTEGFIPSGNARSLVVLHNATNPWPIANRGKNTTTIGTYGYHWFKDDWIHWVTYAPSLETWLADMETKGYINKIKEWRSDMQPRDKRFHKAYWVAANRRELGGLLRRAPLIDVVDPDAGDDEPWPKITVDDLDSDCGHVGAEDRKDAWDVVMGVAEGIGAMNLDHIVCGDPEKPLYEQLLRFHRLRDLRE
ncbi:hypothetical protein P171DRAFT_438031 [Karstenula rhodostoma CBS 690.94]|uniref:Uncharacterized protein n=1 Tax=Karstenula rhodostoma CBS 690.94 TaxID=1392251 RepID=A0A9P4UGM6_9PLEO|nr:hypothetical protein P171DRAFT_438031 [Karstenula rhodostoma CBS 690.94]